MNTDYEVKYHELEERHWWFRSRRDMVFRLIQKLNLPPSTAILEIGCSGGPLLQRLAQQGYTNLTGIDVSETGIAVAQQKGLSNVSCMDGAHLTFPDNSFDLLIASDVLEHIEDDAQALREWNRVLRPGGQLLVFVPAFSFMWSKHDEANQHFRRYTAAQLTSLLAASNLQTTRYSYWNVALFFPAAAVRLLKRMFPGQQHLGKDDLINISPLLDRLLRWLVVTENRLLQLFNAPVGVSVFALARKKSAV